MSGLKAVRVVHAGRPGVQEVPVEEFLNKREGDVSVIDRSVLVREGMACLLPNIRDYDPAADSVVNRWLEYVGKEYPKVVPKYEIVEDAPDYIIVRRRDGQLFKIADNFVGEVLGNSYANAGKSLWDVAVAESLVEARRNPEKFQDSQYRMWYLEWVVYAVGVLTYVYRLIELEFQ